MLDIKESMNKIHQKGNGIKVHWVPGHKDIEGNELADKQAKAAAIEMSKPDVQIEPEFDKKEAVAEMKKQMSAKWNLKYACSEKVTHIQDIFIEVGKRSCFGEHDRSTFSALNQLLCGHSQLNSHKSKLNKTVSSLCETCQEVEDVDHYLFKCVKYRTERSKLEDTVEEILYRENCNDIAIINLQILNGMSEKISNNGQNELIAALMEFIKCSRRFKQN